MKKYISLDKNQRLIVISDIHGNLDSFLQLLELCQFSENDRLIILGDIIEKGPKSLETLEYVKELAKQDNVDVIKGNCDDILSYYQSSDRAKVDVLNYLNNNPFSIYHQRAEKLGLTINSLAELEQVDQSLGDHRQFIESLPLVLISSDFIFAHAGIRHSEDEDTHYITANRTFLSDGHQFNQIVIVGHMPTKNLHQGVFNNNPLYDFTKRIIAIDGGNIVSKGQLNALIITNENNCYSYTHRFTMPYPKIYLTSRVFGSKQEDIKNVRWPNYNVTYKDEKDDLILVETVKLELLWVKADYLELKGDTYRLKGDYTNYYHDVTPIKVGYIIEEDPSEYLVNIDGIVGWIKKEHVCNH